jgi:hypothetical protein
MLRRAAHPRVTLFLERLDDFELETDVAPLEIVQVKSHLGDGGDPTDSSVDLWRTLNVWISALELLDADEIPRFLLLTTATAPQGSAASYLREDERNPSVALDLLRTAAIASHSETTAPWRRRFLALEADQQSALVASIVVGDQQPQLLDITEALKREVSLLVRDEHLEPFVERLRGWWTEQVVRLLTREIPAITVEDIRQFVQRLRDGFSVESLPWDVVPDPTAEESRMYLQRRFTTQLRIVDVAEERITLAISDYHRAYTNTSRWLREGLIEAGELGRYEQKLVTEWRRHFLRMRQDIGPEASEEAMREAGRKLWGQLDGDLVLPLLRPRLDERDVARGSLHQLADRTEIGWHPEFRERLKDLLEDAA